MVAVLTKIALKLLTSEVAERVLILVLESLVKHTKSKVDDKLVDIVKDALKQGKL